MNYLTPSEYIRFYQFDLPIKAIEIIEKLITEVQDTKAELIQSHKNKELIEEQNYFGVELVNNIDKWVNDNLPKTKQKEYSIIRDCTYFET